MRIFFSSENYNLMCCHMRFNYQQVKSVLRHNDTKYVSIIREPLHHFQSSFKFFHDIVPSFQRVSQSTSLEQWIDRADYHVKNSRHSSFSDLEKNSLFFDFGYDNRNDGEDYIKRSIAEIDQVFDLIMISDYIDESLVLLSDLMCWSIEDLACLKLNARAKTTETNAVDQERLRNKVRAWNRSDAALFDHFNATFWRKVNEFGLSKMKTKVQQLQDASKSLSHTCLSTPDNVEVDVIKDPEIRNHIYKPRGVKMTGHELKETAKKLKMCQRLIAPEIEFVKEVFDFQNLKTAVNAFISRSDYIEPI